MPNAAENAPRKPIVCYVTDGNMLGGSRSARVLEKIRMAVAAGVDWVQIREKDMATRELLALVREAALAGARIIVNDRLDVALASGAAGVHLGGESLPARDAIRWCRSGNAPAEFLVGVSCHSTEQARQAEADGASYVFFGPVFDTPSKRPFGPPQGIAKLAEACRAVPIPVIAIGGIHGENAAECLRAGAAGVAAIRMFQEASDPEQLREAIERVRRAS